MHVTYKLEFIIVIVYHYLVDVKTLLLRDEETTVEPLSNDIPIIIKDILSSPSFKTN